MSTAICARHLTTNCHMPECVLDTRTHEVLNTISQAMGDLMDQLNRFGNMIAMAESAIYLQQTVSQKQSNLADLMMQMYREPTSNGTK